MPDWIKIKDNLKKFSKDALLSTYERQTELMEREAKQKIYQSSSAQEQEHYQRIYDECIEKKYFLREIRKGNAELTDFVQRFGNRDDDES